MVARQAVDGRRAETLEKLLEAGATEVAQHSMGDFRWVTMADPDGNVFCVAEGH